MPRDRRTVEAELRRVSNAIADRYTGQRERASEVPTQVVSAFHAALRGDARAVESAQSR